MTSMHNLLLLNQLLAVCRFPAEAPFPEWAQGEDLVALVRTAEEVTIVCAEQFVPPGVEAEPDWRALRVEGPLDFTEVGVLAALAAPLAEAGVSIFVVSTFSTDFILVKAGQLDQALEALQQAGHTVLPLMGRG
jgi:hypothetical protein